MSTPTPGAHDVAGRFFEHLDQRASIAIPFLLLLCGEHPGSARQLSILPDPANRKPEDRIKPMDRLQGPLQHVGPKIPAARGSESESFQPQAAPAGASPPRPMSSPTPAATRERCHKLPGRPRIRRDFPPPWTGKPHEEPPPSPDDPKTRPTAFPGELPHRRHHVVNAGA